MGRVAASANGDLHLSLLILILNFHLYAEYSTQKNYKSMGRLFPLGLENKSREGIEATYPKWIKITFSVIWRIL
jgi:hypothetical protein